MRTDAGLLARLAIGAMLFAAFAVWDLARRGRQARRWREYLFLIIAATAGAAYGYVNDSITSTISWEYFYYGKDLSEQLGTHVPPDPVALRHAAAFVGVKAAGSAALLAGALLLIANNRGRKPTDPPPLRDRALYFRLPGIVCAAAGCGAVFGVLGYFGMLTWTSQAVREAARDGLFRPAHFQCAYGVHLGGYVGGIAGTALAIRGVRRRRRAISVSPRSFLAKTESYSENEKHSL